MLELLSTAQHLLACFGAAVNVTYQVISKNNDSNAGCEYRC